MLLHLTNFPISSVEMGCGPRFEYFFQRLQFRLILDACSYTQLNIKYLVKFYIIFKMNQNIEAHNNRMSKNIFTYLG